MFPISDNSGQFWPMYFVYIMLMALVYKQFLDFGFIKKSFEGGDIFHNFYI